MRLILLTALFGVLLAVSPAWAQLQLSQTQDGIHLKAVDQTLAPVLQNIAEKSGVSFFLPPELKNTPLSADIQAPDWRSLVSELLADFSKIELWNENIAGSKIKITGLGDYVPSAPGTMANTGPPVVTVPEPPDPPRTASRQPTPRQPVKPEELYPDHPLARLPDRIVLEPGVLAYLLQSNVDIPPEFQKKYGLDAENPPPGKAYPIPPHIYNDPAFDEYLEAVGLPKPPQFPQ